MAAWKSFVLIGCMLLAACGRIPERQLTESRPAPLLLVSIDGFRADYLDRGLTPTLSALAEGGVRAEYMRPSFPSLTFPNHYALITGMRPDHSGIVANTMEDPRIPDQKFALWNREAVQDPRWWNAATPLWTTAQRQGLNSGIMFWPGSEAPVDGKHAEFWSTYDKQFSGNSRVDRVLGWLDLPDATRPSLITLYLDTVDVIGHRFGPDSPELNHELDEVDGILRRLLDGLRTRGLHETINIVVVSDHGMMATSPDRVIYLDELLPETYARVISYGVLTGIEPLRGHGRDTEAILLAKHPHMRCWRKRELPVRFHYGSNRRIPPLLCLADRGWTISSHDAIQAKKPFSVGQHGYDNDFPEMRAIFIASGPAFRRHSVVPPFDNVDVYPLLAHLLGIKPEPNDGDFSKVRDTLATR